MSNTTVTPEAISEKTGAAKKVGDDAQQNAAARVREGVPARAHPIIEREEETPATDDAARAPDAKTPAK